MLRAEQREQMKRAGKERLGLEGPALHSLVRWGGCSFGLEIQGVMDGMVTEVNEKS